MQDLLCKAMESAENSHQGQLYNGATYFEGHLVKVALFSEELASKEAIEDADTLCFIKAVAFLHDYLEDTVDYLQTDLKTEFEKLSAQLNAGLASAVLILSRNTYNNDEDYFKTVSENSITKIVKAADRICNILALPELND